MSTAEPPEKRATRSEGYRSLFMDVFPQLVGELTEEGLQNTEISVGIQHLKEVSLILMSLDVTRFLVKSHRFWNTMFLEVGLYSCSTDI